MPEPVVLRVLRGTVPRDAAGWPAAAEGAKLVGALKTRYAVREVQSLLQKNTTNALNFKKLGPKKKNVKKRRETH